jgi:hypothetical protein
MELNHQIRLCRPFPFLFGFRANRNVIVTCKLRFFTYYFIKFLRQWRILLRKEHTCRLALCIALISNNYCTI